MRCEHGSGERRGRAALARVWHGTHRGLIAPATSVTVLAAAMEGRVVWDRPHCIRGKLKGREFGWLAGLIGGWVPWTLDPPLLGSRTQNLGVLAGLVSVGRHSSRYRLDNS